MSACDGFGGIVAGSSAEKTADEEEDGMDMMDVQETKDPVLEKAQLMVQTDMATVSVHQNEAAWAEEVGGQLCLQQQHACDCL